MTDTPGSDGAATVFLPGGGSETYTGFNTASQSYAPARDSQATLAKQPDGTYRRNDGTGWRLDYAHSDGAAAFPRRFHLTKIVDPQGNAVNIGYGANNRMNTITDATGTRGFQLSYELAGSYYKITKVTDTDGRTARFGYDGNGHLSQITDSADMVSQMQTGAANHFVSQLTTPYGITKFTQGEFGNNRWVVITDPSGARERIEYRELAGEIADSEVNAPAGVENTGLRTRNTFYWDKKAMAEAPGDCTQARIIHWLKDAAGSATTGVIGSTKAPLEGRVWYQYAGQPALDKVGASGQPTKIVRLLDDLSTQTSLFSYNALGLIAGSTDPVGRTLTYAYAANNLDLLSVSHGAEVLGSFSDYLNHQPRTATDAAGRTTTITYNGPGQQPDTVTNANNEVSRLVYVPAGTNGAGKVQTSTRAFGTALAAATQYTYDAYQRLQTATEVDGYAVTFGYDAIGGDPLKTLDRLSRITYPDATFEETTWNKLDAEWLRDRRGRMTHQVHDALGRVTDVTDPLNRTTHYEWCNCGALEQLRDPAGNITTWVRDFQNRPTSKIIGTQTVASYIYETKTSRLKTLTDAIGQVATYGYTADDRVAGIAYTGPGSMLPTPNVSFTYDANYPRLASMATAGLGTITHGYVPINPGDTVFGDGQLASVTGLWGDVTTYSYDVLGRMTGRSIGGAANAGSAGFDALGRANVWTNALGAFTPGYVGLTGRLDTVNYPGGSQVDYDYHPNTAAAGTGNGDRRLKQIRNLGPGAALLSQSDYGYGAAGTITQWKQWHSGLGAGVPARRHDLGYDLADQLIADEVHADDAGNALLKLHGYGYDVAGNRTGEQADGSVVTWTANAANQLTSRAGGGSATVIGTVSAGATVKVNSQSVPVTNGQWRASVSVNAGTNTIPVQATETNPTPGTNAQVTNRTLTLTVPAANRTPGYDLNGSVTADGTGRTYQWDGANRLVTIIHAGGTKTRFSYDGMNRWVKLTEETAGGTVTGEKRFVWEGMTLAEERDAANAVTRRFFAEGEQIGGTPYLTFRDHLGSVREMTTLTGTVATRYDYDPYGRRTKLSGALEADFSYTGHYHHALSNLTVAPFRFYDPEMRWLSRDPIGEEGGLNLYGYVGNNPINLWDPLGLVEGDLKSTVIQNALAQLGSKSKPSDLRPVPGRNIKYDPYLGKWLRIDMTDAAHGNDPNVHVFDSEKDAIKNRKCRAKLFFNKAGGIRALGLLGAGLAIGSGMNSIADSQEYRDAISASLRGDKQGVKDAMSEIGLNLSIEMGTLKPSFLIEAGNQYIIGD